jgi:hypothetical protein
MAEIWVSRFADGHNGKFINGWVTVSEGFLLWKRGVNLVLGKYVDEREGSGSEPGPLPVR